MNIGQNPEKMSYSIFDDAPVSLWYEDFSEVKAFIGRLQASGVDDLGAYFKSHPETVHECARKAKVVNVNKATLSLYKARSKKELLAGIDKTFTEKSFDIFREKLLALADGKRSVVSEAVTKTLTGELINVVIQVSISPGYEDTWSQVLVAITDISERKRTERALGKVSWALQTLSRCNKVLIHAKDEGQFLSDICEAIVIAGGYRLAWIGRAEHNKAKSVTPVAEAGFDEGYLEKLAITWADSKRGRGPTGTAIRTGEPSIAQDIQHDPRYAPWREAAVRHGFQSSIALPLIIDQDVYGALIIYAPEPDAFGGHEVSILQELADDVGYGIAVLRTRAAHTKAEEEIRTREAQLSLINTHACDVIFAIGVEPDDIFRFLWVNRRFLEATALAESQIVGKPVQEVIPEPDHELVLGKYKEAIRTGQPVHWEEVSVYPAGKKTGEVTVAPVFDEAGKCIQLIGTVHDITEQKLAYEALAASEEKATALNKVLEESLNEIYIFDAETLKFIQVNYGARLNLGYEMDELSNLTPLDLKPEFTETSFKKLINPLRSGKKEKLRFTTVHRRKDGTLYSVEVNLQLSRFGSREVFVAIILDISERKQSEEVLRREQEQTRQIIDTARDAFVSMNTEGNITDWNPQAEETFGWSREDVLGRSVSQTIMPLESGKAHEKGLKHFLATGEGPVLNQHIEAHALHRDGHTFPVELSIVPVRFDHTVSFNAFICNLSAQAEAKRMLKESLVGTIVAVSKAVEARDAYTAGHQRRVAQLSRAIAQEIGLDADQIDGLRMGATIHDIGKIHLPAEILSKPSKLSDMEFELVKSHSQVGYDILKDVSFPWPVADIAYQHHERLDGSGYPQGLKGDEICLEARIVAVADVVEAMSSHRPYRPALGTDAALEEIESKRGRFYDPDVVDACLKLFREKIFRFE